MTNEKIRNRFNVVQQAMQQDVFSSTKIKYALTSNAKRLEKAIEPYQDEMEDLREEYQDDLQELQEKQEEIQERYESAEGQEKQEVAEELQELSPPDEFTEAREELLEMEGGDPEPYNVSDTYLDNEEDVDIQFLYQLDWMFVDEL